MVTAEEVATLRVFLYDGDGSRRRTAASPWPEQLLPTVAGVPTDRGPEAFLEMVAGAKSSR